MGINTQTHTVQTQGSISDPMEHSLCGYVRARETCAMQEVASLFQPPLFLLLL